MVTSVSNGAQQSPVSAKTFQPGGSEQDRQVREKNDRQTRVEQSSVARGESVERSSRLDEIRAEQTREREIDNGRAAARSQSRGSVVDVTV
jgi:hypothetical protein